jgi:dihydroorotase
MLLHVTGGRLIDPGHYDGFTDIIVENGKSAGIVEGRPAIDGKQTSNNRQPEVQIIDARNKIVTPGLIDMHVH